MGFQIRIRNSRYVPLVFLVKDLCQEVRIDGIHDRGLMTRQFEFLDWASESLQDSVADHLETDVSDIMACPNDTQHQ